MKEKGETLGFKATYELPKMKRDYSIDLVWTPYEQSHDIFITFEIESKENARVYKNFDKIFVTRAKDIEKPYHHFVIIYKGKLKRGDRRLINRKAKEKNVHIFENLKYDSSELKWLEQELQKLRIEIPSLIQRRAKGSTSDAVTDAILGIKAVTPVFLLKQEQVTWDITATPLPSQEKEGLPLQGEPSQIFQSKKYSGYAIVPIPKKKYLLVIPGTQIKLEVYSEKKEDITTLLVEFEGCDSPIFFHFSGQKGKGAKLNLKINPAYADVVQLKQFEDLVRGFSEKKTFEVFDEKGELVLGGEGIKVDFLVSNETWYSAINDLAEIQTATQQRIPAPSNLWISTQDYEKIQKIKAIIEKGVIQGTLASITITLSKEVAQNLVREQKNTGKITCWLHSEQDTESLFGTTIQLGPSTIKNPDMIFKESLEQMEKKIDDISQNGLIEVVLVPQGDKKVKGVYDKWQRVP